MNNKEKVLQKEMVSYIEKLGAKPLSKNKGNYTHVINSYIGNFYLRVDSEGSIFSLFGNFLENPIEAKEEFGHWKMNYHTTKSVSLDTIKEEVKYHLNFVK